MRFLERKEDRVSHPPGTFLHSPPRGKPRHSATKRKEKLSIGETKKGENPRPFTGLPAVAAVSYLGLRGAPLYRRTATLDSLPLRLSLLVFQPSPRPDSSLSSHLSTTLACTLCATRDRDRKQLLGLWTSQVSCEDYHHIWICRIFNWFLWDTMS